MHHQSIIMYKLTETRTSPFFFFLFWKVPIMHLFRFFCFLESHSPYAYSIDCVVLSVNAINYPSLTENLQTLTVGRKATSNKYCSLLWRDHLIWISSTMHSNDINFYDFSLFTSILWVKLVSALSGQNGLFPPM